MKWSNLGMIWVGVIVVGCVQVDTPPDETSTPSLAATQESAPSQTDTVAPDMLDVTPLPDITSPITAALSRENHSITHPSGITIQLASDTSVELALGSIPEETFLTGELEGDFLQARTALPDYLELKSPIYTIQRIGGDAQASFWIELPLPDEELPFEGYDLYRWDTEHDEWVFLPSNFSQTISVGQRPPFRPDMTDLPEMIGVFHTQHVAPRMGTILEPDQVLGSDMADLLDVVYPAGLEVQADGSLSGDLASSWQTGAGYAVIPLVRGDAITVIDILEDDTRWQGHIQALLELAQGADFDGIAIDYTSIDLAFSDGEVLSEFVRQLAEALHNHNKLLVVYVGRPNTGPEGSSFGWYTGPFDWQAIGQAADIVIVHPSESPSIYYKGESEVGYALRIIEYATDEISRLKLQIASPALSYRAAGFGSPNDTGPVDFEEALAPLGKISLLTQQPEGGFDQGNTLSFNLDGMVADIHRDEAGNYAYTHQINEYGDQYWIVTAHSIQMRLDTLALYHPDGLILTHLAADGTDGGLATVLSEFKAGDPSSVADTLEVHWIVYDASGTALSSAITDLGTRFTWQAAESGDYLIACLIVGQQTYDCGTINVSINTP